MSSRLVFLEDNGPGEGFATPHVDREKTSPETVIRELLQNSLDASPGSAEVDFYYTVIPLAELPQMDDYREAYYAARAEWDRRGQGPPGENAVKRADEALESTSTGCLVCVDKGGGITAQSLRSLYGVGATTKPDSGRGSVGQGHLTAFAFSDLRYVLYAGRHDEAAGEGIFGGHAILATHIGERSGTPQQYAAHGYVMAQTSAPGQLKLWGDDAAHGAPFVPPLFADWLPPGQSGGAVMIAAYNPPGLSSPSQLPDRIVSAAAKNFVVAILDGQLSVRCHIAANPPSELSRRADLERALVDAKAQKYRTRHSLGPSGSHAHRAWLAARDDNHLVPLDETPEWQGVRVWLRPLTGADDPDEGRVYVFRDGMWITDECPKLARSDFGQCNPFDAVVDVVSDGPNKGEYGMLVRKAEGASHYEIAPTEIADSKQRERLNQLLERLREVLRREAGDRPEEQEHVPRRLARFGGQAPAPRRRPRSRPVRDDDWDDHDDDEPDEPPRPVPPLPPAPDPPTPSPPRPSPKPHRRKRTDRVRRGQSDGVRTAVGGVTNGDTVMIVWRAKRWRAGSAGLQLMIPPGTDEASEQQGEPRYLRIAEVLVEGSDDDETSEPLEVLQEPGIEVLLEKPPRQGSAVVTLAPGPDNRVTSLDAGLLRAEMVHRATPRPTNQ